MRKTNSFQSFLEPLPGKLAVEDSGKAFDAVWPLPMERTVSFGKGTAGAPDAIVRAGAELERYDEELEVPIDWNVRVLPAVDDSGEPFAEYLDRVETMARAFYREHAFVVALGGEHTVTIPLVRAAAAEFGSLGVLHIDAHADLRTQYQGEPLSHACVMHHVRAITPKTLSVGIRGLSVTEAERIRRERIAVMWAWDTEWLQHSNSIDRALALLPERVYVTIDLDGFDPSVVPGVGTPEPGGLGWYPVLRLLRRVFTLRRVVGADIVEGVPLPGAPVTEFAAARLALKLMVYRRMDCSINALREGK